MADIPLYTLEQGMEQLDSLQGDGLMVIDAVSGPASYGDVAAWYSSIEQLCEPIFQVLDRQLKASRVNIELYTAEGRRFNIQNRNRYKFWRRNRPLSEFVNTRG